MKKIILVGTNADIINKLSNDFDLFWLSTEDVENFKSNEDYFRIRDNPERYKDTYKGDLNHLIRYVRGEGMKIYETYCRHWVVDRSPPPIPEFEVLLYSHTIWAGSLIENFQPDVVIFANLPHEGYDNVLELCAQALNVPTISLFNVPFAPYHWRLTEGSALSFLLEDDKLSLEGDDCDPKFAYLSSFILNCIGIGFHSYMGGEKSVKVLSKSILNNVVKNQISRFSFEQKGEKYIYFPLHLQPELTTSVLGGEYVNQLYAIKLAAEWASNIGCKLFVKENPKQGISHRGDFFWRGLCSIPNVKLVEKNIDTHKLIGLSEGVVTISGTAGIEGLLMQKPVICLGSTYWKNFNGVFSSFPSKEDFNDYIHASFDITYNNLVKVFQKAFPGANDHFYRDFYGIATVQNNNDIANSIKKSVKELS